MLEMVSTKIKKTWTILLVILLTSLFFYFQMKQVSAAIKLREEQQLLQKEKILSNIENFYFKNKLYKGMTFEGLRVSIVGIFDRSNPYYSYRMNIRAAGYDKAAPDAFYDRKGAIEQFNLLRVSVGLKPRKYPIQKK